MNVKKSPPLCRYRHPSQSWPTVVEPTVLPDIMKSRFWCSWDKRIRVESADLFLECCCKWWHVAVFDDWFQIQRLFNGWQTWGCASDLLINCSLAASKKRFKRYSNSGKQKLKVIEHRATILAPLEYIDFLTFGVEIEGKHCSWRLVVIGMSKCFSSSSNRLFYWFLHLLLIPSRVLFSL